MMKLKTVIFAFILCLIGFGTPANAQIGYEIMSYVDSTELLVSNGRKLILQKIEAKDFLKVQEIYNHLNQKTNKKRYAAFSYTEHIYLNLVICDWTVFKHYATEYAEYSKLTPYPEVPKITTELANSIGADNEELLNNLQTSELPIEDREIAEIVLLFLRDGTADKNVQAKLKAYNKSYPQGAYKQFIKNFLPQPLGAYSLAYTFGGGYVSPTGNLSRHFSPNGMFHFSMDVNIDKVYTSLYFSGTTLKLKEPFSAYSKTHDFDFAEGENFSLVYGGIKGGYFIARNKYFHFAPYATLSGATLESTRFYEEQEGKEFRVFNSFSCGLGLHTELKFKEFKPRYQYNAYGYYGEKMKSYLSLKMDVGYDFVTGIKYDKYKGHIPSIVLSLSYGIGDF